MPHAEQQTSMYPGPSSSKLYPLYFRYRTIISNLKTLLVMINGMKDISSMYFTCQCKNSTQVYLRELGRTYTVYEDVDAVY